MRGQPANRRAVSTTFWYPERSILLADDRRLSVAQCGTRDGIPVIYLRGAPGSRLNRYPFDDDLLELGVRLITYALRAARVRRLNSRFRPSRCRCSEGRCLYPLVNEV